MNATDKEWMGLADAESEFDAPAPRPKTVAAKSSSRLRAIRLDQPLLSSRSGSYKLFFKREDDFYLPSPLVPEETFDTRRAAEWLAAGMPGT